LVTDRSCYRIRPLTGTSTELVTDKRCYRLGHRQTLPQNWTLIDTSGKLFTDRHCYITGHRQTLLHNWSLKEAATDLISMPHNRSHTDTATGSVTYRHCHTLSPLQTTDASTKLSPTDNATDLVTDKQRYKIILLDALPRN